MKHKITLLLLLVFSSTSWAVKISDYSPFVYEVLFTNPSCRTYSYDRPMISHSGQNLDAKPQGVYCKNADEELSVSRKNSPHYRLIEWITNSDTRELYVAYLSFRNTSVAKAFCSALNNGVKLTMILDGKENKQAENLKKCGQVNLVYRGNTGGLGYAHNKILMVNPNDAKVSKVVFSSGNLTTGTSINHENWNFITTSSKSYFSQAHKCVVEAMVEAGDTKANFTKNLNTCREKIKAQPESDITVFFSPIDGKKALEQVTESARQATLIEGISHRFSGALTKLIAREVQAGKKVKFILDDDIYWSEKLKKNVGRNTKYEAFEIFNTLINRGMETKFLETNQNIYQLQHNKFLIFTFNNTGAVFSGAGNLTTSAFTKNFENFYYIRIPEVVEAYNRQYDLYFDKMGTDLMDMPRDNVMP